MKGLAVCGKGEYAVVERPIPEIVFPTDAIVKMTKTTICGTDLHIIHGQITTVPPGRILGHEGVGIITQVGPAVKTFKPGDKVIVTGIIPCGTCAFCKRGTYGHCTTGGWVIGNSLDGTHGEYVRVPYADTGLNKVSDKVDDVGSVMIADVLPTALECGVLSGRVKPGSTVAIVGAGPVGLGVVLTAHLYSPMKIIVIDTDENRLRLATQMGATHVLVSGPDTTKAVMELTDGAGVDTAVEAVGLPAAFDMCQQIIGVGGTIANIGIHGSTVALDMGRLWNKNITLTTRLVDTVTIPMLVKLVEAGKIDARPLVTHTYKFADIVEAYSAFDAAAKNKVLKVIIEFD
ncbi:alcohol dehydrogenase GroES domain protein [Gloeophyllum trabeum ATCC 11539]|uniref:Alcohol dehydrogenase GroES domain protein n=1 Tax=Gloeophyllum trabeum (strain ATCC 11539 / FP-39264 / Madison 617) TaxID=670483 RepID=S7RFW5_GLOTA|nr:alcohol dehydrogenase GroES domain protein [Gloeophyllum trabeum ATCC 11539]EPQ51409.1 alcohol dehydrogenase GroES domain protein [Gloeophyllum trabeum ATCC 11539]